MSNVVRPVGMPDGPKVFVPEIGKEVGTFNAEPGGKVPALKHHVPLKCRGPYRPEELANYEPEKTYRTDPFGYMLCTRFTLAGERCDKRAVNRYPACTVHGGRLHPLDKLQKEIPEDKEAQELSRYQQFLAKQIDVDDLDDLLKKLSTASENEHTRNIEKCKEIISLLSDIEEILEKTVDDIKAILTKLSSKRKLLEVYLGSGNC